MAISSKARVDASSKKISIESIADLCLKRIPLPFNKKDSFSIIAEIKKRSPADGLLANESFDIEAQAKIYIDSKVSAISVLTEPDAFHGSVNDLQAVSSLANKNNIPTLRKDFIVDSYQLYEARYFGASGALLIVKMLEDDLLISLIRVAQDLNLFLLIECFDLDDIERLNAILANILIMKNGPSLLLGINCRDLKTLKVNPNHFEKMAPHLISGYSWVAESGISHPIEIKEIIRYGYHAALIGSALMRSSDPKSFTEIIY
jgi:indole-3-glycerol phosphate synthase